MTMATFCFKASLVLTLLVQLPTAHAQSQSLCDYCEQRPTLCRRIAGLYTVTVLTQGTYNPVVEIPAQACGINITELAPSHNYLAVRTESGENVVNGYWSVGSTGSFRGAGTQFEYNRGAAGCPGECIFSRGPTNQAVIVQLLYYSKNPGIAYEFVLPTNVPFKPFDETAPNVESRTRTHHRSSHHQQELRQHQHQQQLQPNVSRGEPYDPGYARRQEEATAVQEPRRQITPAPEVRRQVQVQGQRRAALTSEAEDEAGSSAREPSTDYRGVSYGSHTLGGRGQSYTFQQPNRSVGLAPEESDPSRRHLAGAGGHRDASRRRPVVRRQPTPVRPQPPQSYLSSGYGTEGFHGHGATGSSGPRL